MKITIEIPDELYWRALQRARTEGRTLQSLIVDGLRRSLEPGARETRGAFRLADRSVGDPEGRDPLADRPWTELRDEIYGGR